MRRLAGDNPGYPGIGPNTRSTTEPAISLPIHPSMKPKTRRYPEMGPGQGTEEPHFNYPAGDNDLFDYDHQSERATEDIQSFARDKLLFNSDRLVDEAVDIILQVNSQILTAAFPEQITLSRMDMRVVRDGHLIEGDLEFSLHLVSPAFGRRGQVTVLIPIREGTIIPPSHLINHRGERFEISDRGVKDLLSIRDEPVNILFWKGPSQRSYIDER